MRATWEALKQSLLRSLVGDVAELQFEEMRLLWPCLWRFPNAKELLRFLNSRRGDLDEKDAIYTSLVEAVQVGGDDEILARALVWLGLWPRITTIFGKRRRDFRASLDELVSEIGVHFSKTINRIDLTGVTRLASTLMMNLERDLRDGLKRRWAEDARFQCESEFGNSGGDAGPLLDDRELPVDANDLPALRTWLAGIVGEDADFVIGAAIYEFNLHELADSLGISHEAARKRYQRRLKQLRKWINKMRESESQFVRDGRVSHSRSPNLRVGR